MRYAGPAPSGSSSAARLARLLMVVVFCGLATTAVLGLAARPMGAGALVLAIVLVLVLLALLMGYFARVASYGPGRYPALAVMAVLSLGPVGVFGVWWVGIPGFLAGALMLALPLRVAVPAFVVVVAFVVAALGWFGSSPYDMAYGGISTVITGSVIYGLARLAHVVGELERTRGEVARLEVSRERLRIAQDLHDLLGSSLTAVTLRTELARAHVRSGGDAARVEEDLRGVVQLSRQALAEVRAVSAGPLRTSLRAELRHVTGLLESAGMTTRLDVDDTLLSALPLEAELALAAALREGVANVLRHGGGRHCRLRVVRADGEIVLEMTNDLPERPDATPLGGVPGQGLDNLRERLRTTGGRLDTAMGAAEWRMRASLPGQGTAAARPAAALD